MYVCLCVLKYLSDSDETLVSKCAQAREHCKYRPSNSDVVGVVFVSDCWGGGGGSGQDITQGSGHEEWTTKSSPLENLRNLKWSVFTQSTEIFSLLSFTLCFTGQ